MLLFLKLMMLGLTGAASIAAMPKDNPPYLDGFEDDEEMDDPDADFIDQESSTESDEVERYD